MHFGKEMHFLHNPASCQCIHWLLKSASLSPDCTIADTPGVTPNSNQMPPDGKTGLNEVRRLI